MVQLVAEHGPDLSAQAIANHGLFGNLKPDHDGKARNRQTVGPELDAADYTKNALSFGKERFDIFI